MKTYRRKFSSDMVIHRGIFEKYPTLLPCFTFKPKAEFFFVIVNLFFRRNLL